jgi:hypothetical protein
MKPKPIILVAPAQVRVAASGYFQSAQEPKFQRVTNTDGGELLGLTEKLWQHGLHYEVQHSMTKRRG